MKEIKRKPKELQVKARQCRVVKMLSPTWLEVLSTSGEVHNVVLLPGPVEITPTCDCDWHKYHPGTACSHTLAALAQVERARVSAWCTKEEAVRQHRKVIKFGDLFVTVRRI